MDEIDYKAPRGHEYSEQWKALSGWFLGPRAENKDVFKQIFNEILEKHADTRKAFFPTDPAYITAEIRGSKEYNAEIEDLRKTLFEMSEELKQSVPFFTPRYQAHMLWDVTMPSLLGYMMAMFHCQNNVDTAASSVTTLYEKAVGLQLCDMLGYNIHKPTDGNPKAWGHITCGGSVANIEAVWASRNIKFSAIGLRDAIMTAPNDVLLKQQRKIMLDYKVNVLAYITETGKYKMTAKAIGDCSKRELLNMDIDEYCGLTARVANYLSQSNCPFNKEKGQFDKFTAFVDTKGYAAVGDRQFMERHKINPAVYMVPANCHYSWPKAGTLLGLGSDALIPVPLDDNFRTSIDDLKTLLIDAVNADRPILSVTAVIGSTEESAVDDITKMYHMRNELKEKHGVNYALLADGAWGGYMKTMIRGKTQKERTSYKPSFVPFMGLSPYVEEQYSNLQYADTITIDPHKSGFCPYPAGALCYRNGDMRYFIAFLHPEVYHGEDDPTMGVYGIEGSKPGAAPTAVFASHKVVGLDVYGYGRILGQCQTTCKLFWCLWHTLARPNDPYICVPIQTLPKKYQVMRNDGSNQSHGEYLIRNKILGRSMADIFDDEEVKDLLTEVGPDTLINTFVVNMKDENGQVNTEVKKANDLQKALSDSLNVTVGKCNERVPIILMQSGLNNNHGRALENYKQRIGLNNVDGTTLNVMVNTAMNPWQWNESITILGSIFRTQILNCMGKVSDLADYHEFIICGTFNKNKELFAEFIPDFNTPTRQYHLVVKLKLYDSCGSINGGSKIRSVKPLKLHDFLQGKNLKLEEGDKNKKDKKDNNVREFAIYKNGKSSRECLDLEIVDIIHFEHFDMAYGEYENKQTYMMYGDEGRTYMSHCLRKAPDFMQVVELHEAPYGITKDLLTLGVKVEVSELNGSPKYIEECIVDPLDNKRYTISYRGREFASCQSTADISRTVFFKELWKTS